MLVLTRNVGETIVIADDITVTVIGVQGNQVRIGVEAPKDVPVHREEIFRRINGENSPKTAWVIQRKAGKGWVKFKEFDNQFSAQKELDRLQATRIYDTYRMVPEVITAAGVLAHGAPRNCFDGEVE